MAFELLQRPMRWNMRPTSQRSKCGWVTRISAQHGSMIGGRCDQRTHLRSGSNTDSMPVELAAAPIGLAHRLY